MWLRFRSWWKKLFTGEPNEVLTLTPGMREEQVRIVLSDLLPEDEPYVYRGQFNWFCLNPGEEPRKISFFFLDLPLCIQVHGPEVASPKERSDNSEISLSANEQEAADFLRAVCKEHGFGLIEIFWDGEINKYNLERSLTRLNIISPTA
jgi:hypothetical protein